jgi:biopolymer transport protein ExbD
MRRFSQRNSLVTLSDINITPLLDLAFVLLIIFVITTPLLEQGLNLNLPKGGRPDQVKLDRSDIRTIDVSPQGQYRTGGRYLALDDLARQLKVEHDRNPKLLVYIRGDQNSLLKYVTALLDKLEQAGVDQVSLRTQPTTTSR